MKNLIRHLMVAWLIFAFPLSYPLLASGDALPYNYYSATTPMENGQTYGLGVRDNGLDLDDDFLVGESGVDDTVCDETGGTASGGNGGYYEDVDGDGDDERQWFFSTGVNVSADFDFGTGAGADDGTCGEPDDPCASFSQAKTNADQDIVDNGTTGEIIFCMSGDITSGGISDLLDISGDTGTKTMTAGTVTDSERLNFQYPSNPTMLVGVDADDDGVYPPNDTGDRACFTDDSTAALWSMGTDGSDRIEVAHICTTQWAQGVKENMSLMLQAGASALKSHIFMHDTSHTGLHAGECHNSGTIILNMFSSNREWVAWEFNEVTDMIGYIARGGYGAANHRIRGNSVGLAGGGRSSNTNEHSVSCNNSGGNDITPFRVWDVQGGTQAAQISTNLEIIDNHFFFEGWESGARNGRFWRSPISICGVRDVYIVGNLYEDWAGIWSTNHGDDECSGVGTTQYTGGFYFERNIWRNPNRGTAAFDISGSFIWINIQDGNNPTEGGTDGDWHFKHNVFDFSSSEGTDESNHLALWIWSNTSGDGYDDINVVMQDLEFRGCFDYVDGILLDWPALGSADQPDDITIERITIYSTGCTSADRQAVALPDVEHTANFTMDSVSMTHCESDLNGQVATEGAHDAVSGVSNTDCSATAPTLDNYANAQSGGGGGTDYLFLKGM